MGTGWAVHVQDGWKADFHVFNMAVRRLFRAPDTEVLEFTERATFTEGVYGGHDLPRPGRPMVGQWGTIPGIRGSESKT